ncbi:MAG: DUF488 family protein, N3 subclade [Gammaproteobacteria bacterium]
MLDLKRVYDPSSAEEGYRALVDRLWLRSHYHGAGRV